MPYVYNILKLERIPYKSFRFCVMSAFLSLHFLLKEGGNSKMKEETRSEN